jgi:hypothetical protein
MLKKKLLEVKTNMEKGKLSHEYELKHKKEIDLIRKINYVLTGNVKDFSKWKSFLNLQEVEKYVNKANNILLDFDKKQQHKGDIEKKTNRFLVRKYEHDFGKIDRDLKKRIEIVSDHEKWKKIK